jgi:hypothetical protein
MKTVFARCRKCGKVKLEKIYRGEQGETYVPTALCETIEDVAQAYREFEGLTYRQSTGLKVEKCFKKRTVSLNHSDINKQGHSIGKHECWCEII